MLLTSEQLKEKINSGEKMVIKFEASWCGPCKALAPILEDIKRERGDDIEVVKVDVDANPEIARFLNAEAIPDVRIYQGGVQVYDFVGLMPKAEIDSILKSLK